MDKLTRISTVDAKKCNPKKCKQECKRLCPVVIMGKECISISKTADISEILCNGCGICVKKCPLDAIRIINVPTDLDKDTVHRYGVNAFKLHRLPMPRRGSVLGLVGSNGVGKSTVLKILAGKLVPNFGKFDVQPSWINAVERFKGSELQSYFTKVASGELQTIIKPQYVDKINTVIDGTVRNLLERKNSMDNMESVVKRLNLDDVMSRNVCDLSGGELQRFAIAMVCIQRADVYIFDEPSSYLDIKQRLAVAETIRSLVSNDTYVIVVDHDLVVLDYASDYVCCLYGEPSAYGVVTLPYGVRDGINVYLDGFIPTENLRFRDAPLVFKPTAIEDEQVDRRRSHRYPNATQRFDEFQLDIRAGEFTDSEIIVMMGENGTGKTTFIRTLAKYYADNLSVSCKPQRIVTVFDGTVQELLCARIRSSYLDATFVANVIKPLKVHLLSDHRVKTLSGGELQRVAIALCLGKTADVYLIDEPSAHLDCEMRLVAAKVIKQFVYQSKRTAFIVEHDFIMSTYLADRVIVFNGIASVDATANSPESLASGVNKFLSTLGVTFRRDGNNWRPRVNKPESCLDVEQKRINEYFKIE